MIVNFYKSKMLEQANAPEKMKYVDLVKLMSKEIGIGQRTISTTLSEYKNNGTVSSPNKIKVRLTITDKIDDFDKNAIRQKIHGFWVRREIPTLRKMLAEINDDNSLPNFKHTSLQLILKDLNFSYCKINRNSALLTERNDIICWRQRFIADV